MKICEGSAAGGSEAWVACMVRDARATCERACVRACERASMCARDQAAGAGVLRACVLACVPATKRVFFCWNMIHSHHSHDTQS